LAIEKIIMPQLGESITEGTISKWLISVGDQVNKYDPLVEVMTDKVSAEVPSSFKGMIKTLIANEGETLAVGEAICEIETEEVMKSIQTVTNAEVIHKEVQKDEQRALSTDQSSKARYSPAVLKLSQEHGIDLNQVKGTGMGGRITRKDLLKIVESGEIQIPMTKENESIPAEPNQTENIDVQKESLTIPSAMNASATAGDIEIPVHGVRSVIASNMVKSKQEIPHGWMMVEVDVTNLVQYRNSIKNEFKKREGFNLTPFAFFVKAVAQSLKEYPQMNSTWAGDKIIRKKEVNLSIAVATEDALFVPVIKHADEKTIKGIAREISELAKKVRNETITAEEFKGGTFTVNNTGAIGSIQSMGIINYPQAAILQVESIVKRPVIMENNMMAVRDMVNLCLSLDHRILDGFICGKFMHRLKEILEKTSKENTSIY
jgi:2-oxoisovalerate dehydrogenase E2 component (dihydrolipoyl transacylase)